MKKEKQRRIEHKLGGNHQLAQAEIRRLLADSVRLSGMQDQLDASEAARARAERERDQVITRTAAEISDLKADNQRLRELLQSVAGHLQTTGEATLAAADRVLKSVQ